MKNFEDDSHDSPMVIGDINLIHPEDHARLMDEVGTVFNTILLLCIQQRAASSAEPVSGRSLAKQTDEIYEEKKVYPKRVYRNLKKLRELGLVEREQVDDTDRPTHDYRLTPAGKGFLKRHGELVVGLTNGYDYQTILQEGPS